MRVKDYIRQECAFDLLVRELCIDETLFKNLLYFLVFKQNPLVNIKSKYAPERLDLKDAKTEYSLSIKDLTYDEVNRLKELQCENLKVCQEVIKRYRLENDDDIAELLAYYCQALLIFVHHGQKRGIEKYLNKELKSCAITIKRERYREFIAVKNCVSTNETKDLLWHPSNIDCYDQYDPCSYYAVKQDIANIVRRTLTPRMAYICLCYCSGRSVKEIADELEVTVPTIYTQVREGRKRLANAVVFYFIQKQKR